MKMPDFPEVMRRLNRMCQHYHERPLGCLSCPLAGSNTRSGESCFYYIKSNPIAALEIIQRWNREHPELIYPTWRACFGEGHPDTPIPADVADKLGVKPHTRQEE